MLVLNFMFKALKSALSVLVLSSVFISPAKATIHVTLAGELLRVESRLERQHTISYEFRRCMANHLYTFSRVLVDTTTVNEATSDNIGPFLIGGAGWTGGNHLLASGLPSAYTDSISIFADGRRIMNDFSGEAQCVRVCVSNTLLNPSDSSQKFCTESITYTICGNSIQVSATHHYLNRQPLTVDRYYGMQSMMIGETEILTPGGEYSRWTPVDSVDRFTRKSAPRFHQFIEKSNVCYAAAFLTDAGLGDHHLISDDDVVFIGNSWSKSYHKLMGNSIVKCGETTHWEGVYTWFLSPLVSDPDHFSYIGYFNGKPAVFSHNKLNDHISLLK